MGRGAGVGENIVIIGRVDPEDSISVKTGRYSVDSVRLSF